MQDIVESFRPPVLLLLLLLLLLSTGGLLIPSDVTRH